MGSIRLIMIALLLPLSAWSVGPTDEELLAGFKKILRPIRNKLGEAAYVQIQEEALAKFNRGEFEDFDPLVGDTSCQLRALPCTACSNSAELSEDARNWIVLSYLLGRALVVLRGDDGFNIHDQQGINSGDHLNAFLARFKTKLSKNVISDLKRAVAYYSVLFARQQARLIANGAVRNDVEDLFNNQCMPNDGGGRPVLSCIAICDLLLERARALRFPVVLRLRLATGTRSRTLGTIRIVYVANDLGVFVRVNPATMNPQTRVVVVEGLVTRFEGRQNPPSATEVNAYIEGLDFEYAMRIEHELHPQFAGPQGEQPLVNTNNNAIARGWAQIRERYNDAYLGRDEHRRITQNDPRPFAIDHIFAATIQDIERYNPFNGGIEAPIQVDLPNAVYYRGPILSAAERFAPAILALSVAMLQFAQQGSLK